MGDHQAQVLETLSALRTYALEKSKGNGLEVGLIYHEEDSYLMRFANSAISLNTNEHLIRLEIVAYEGRKRANYELITDLNKIDEMKAGIDTAIDLVEHVQPLNYEPTIPNYTDTYVDESVYDPALAEISNTDRLAYFNQTAGDLETDDIRLSGIFSNGSNIMAMISTRSEASQYFRTSDAQVTAVLAHAGRKWEAIAEQSAHERSNLDAGKLNQELSLLVNSFQRLKPQQLPLGTYDIVFGPAATAEMVSFMNWIAFSGGSMKRGFSFLGEDKLGERVFSDKFSLTDDPTLKSTFPYRRDFYGLDRKPFSIFKDGVFKAFTWFQDDADEFGAQPTGHTVNHKSLVLEGGQGSASSLAELITQPRERDLLYIPYLHYMNIVNPSKGVITATSRFGTLQLKANGEVAVPFNVRLTQSLLDIFGDGIDWMSKETVAYNTSSSYGARNPTAVVVPVLVCVNGLEISHSNDAF